MATAKTEHVDPEWEFGRVEETPDLTPVPIRIVTYDQATDPPTPHEHLFHVLRTESFGREMSLVEAADAMGNVRVNAENGRAVQQWIQRAIVPSERERFEADVMETDHYVDAGALGELLNKLVELYSRRPTKRPSVPPSTASTTGRTTTGARSARGSGSTRSTRQKATT